MSLGADDDNRGHYSSESPLRRCLATDKRLPKAELLRFVVGPAGTIVFDVAGRLPGRGLWLKAERDMISTAASKRLFSKAARQTVSVSDSLADEVTAGLKRRCLDLLGLARRAGLVSVGFEQVRAALQTMGVVVLIEAADGSADGRRKITGSAAKVPVIDTFTGEELGRALGREHAVHAALGAGGLTDIFRRDVSRLYGVLPG